MKVPFNVDLKNKVVVITGAAGVLCSVFAEAMAQCGAKVALLDINREKAERLAESIKNNGGTAAVFTADVLDKHSLESARREVVNKLGTCDILINGAGGNNPKGTTNREYILKEDLENENDLLTFLNLPSEAVEFVFNLNFLGTLIPTQVFSRDMIDKEEGTIINISSMNAFRPLTKIPAYSGAKAAVSNFTQWLAVHMSKVNIRVNAIAPGFFLTEQNRSLLTKEDGSFTERADKIVQHTPMGRFGEPEELIGTLLWLLDKNSSGFVTGTVIPVDGGFSAYSGV